MVKIKDWLKMEFVLYFLNKIVSSGGNFSSNLFSSSTISVIKNKIIRVQRVKTKTKTQALVPYRGYLLKLV